MPYVSARLPKRFSGLKKSVCDRRLSDVHAAPSSLPGDSACASGCSLELCVEDAFRHRLASKVLLFSVQTKAICARCLSDGHSVPFARSQALRVPVGAPDLFQTGARNPTVKFPKIMVIVRNNLFSIRSFLEKTFLFLSHII